MSESFFVPGGGDEGDSKGKPIFARDTGACECASIGKVDKIGVGT